MSYQRPEYVRVVSLPKQGRDVYFSVEGFLNKEEAEQYANNYYYANWGYGPSTKLSEQEDGTWNVNIRQMDSCD